MCEQGKIHSGTSLEQMGKPLHAGAIKAEPGLRGSILNIWILPERPLAVSLDKGNAGAGDEMGHLRFRPSTVNERPQASVTIN